MKPSNEVFAKAVKKARREVGFVATSLHMPHIFVPGETAEDLHHFPMRIKIVEATTAKEWNRFVAALCKALPEGQRPIGKPRGRFRYYKVRLLRAAAKEVQP